MSVSAFRTQAIVAIFLAIGIASPGLADPAPVASPTPATSATPTPAPIASGEYKEQVKMAALAMSLLLQAQTGEIDRSMLESKMNLALSPSMAANLSQQLAPLGKPKSISFISRTLAGAYTAYKYRIVWSGVAADESFALNSDGKIVAWLFQPAM